MVVNKFLSVNSHFLFKVSLKLLAEARGEEEAVNSARAYSRKLLRSFLCDARYNARENAAAELVGLMNGIYENRSQLFSIKKDRSNDIDIEKIAALAAAA
jgi:hypothetical protein